MTSNTSATPSPDSSPHKPDSSRDPILEVRDLRTYFRTEQGIGRAVDGVSFTLGRGQTLGLVGESGCGKSVTALSVLRLVSPPGYVEGGEIRLAGRDLLQLPDDEMRKVRGDAVAMIFQEPMTALNPVLSVGEQVAEVLVLHEGLARDAAWRGAVDLLDQVGIPL
ncbi:MAG: ATP-binding cassette domain-containing protein, partial [Candidatus Latescibacteria bacterium]|nr:ATP-binding cassette domain-containing protein [Candidatus Latescibacterota bacterium]